MAGVLCAVRKGLLSLTMAARVLRRGTEGIGARWSHRGRGLGRALEHEDMKDRKEEEQEEEE